VAKSNADAAYSDVVLALHDPVLRSTLESLLRDTSARMAFEEGDITDEMKERLDDILREEALDAAEYGIKRSELEQIFKIFLDNSIDLRGMVASGEACEELLATLHRKNLEEHRLSLTEPRKEKKARRRDLVRGSFNILTGIAIVVANTKSEPAFAYSYALGGGSILEGMRDYLGKESE